MNPKRALAAACAAVVLTVGASGCASAAKKAVDKSLKDHGVNVNSKDSSVTFKDDSGNAVTYGTTKLPDGWPKELSLPSDTTVTASIKNTSSDGDTFVVSVDSKKSVKDLVSAFKTKLEDAGYKKGDESSFGGGTDEAQTIVYTKGNRQVTVIATSTTESDSRSSAQISVAPNPDSGSSGSSSSDALSS